MLLTLGQLFNYFSNLIIYHSLEDKTKSTVAKTLGINPYFVGEISQASRKYSIKQAVNAIQAIKNTDAQLKGIEASQIAEKDLLKILVVKIVRS